VLSYDKEAFVRPGRACTRSSLFSIMQVTWDWCLYFFAGPCPGGFNEPTFCAMVDLPGGFVAQRIFVHQHRSTVRSLVGGKKARMVKNVKGNDRLSVVAVRAGDLSPLHDRGYDFFHSCIPAFHRKSIHSKKCLAVAPTFWRFEKAFSAQQEVPVWNEENDLGLISNYPEELPGTIFVVALRHNSCTGRANCVFENYDLGESQNSFQIVQLQSAFSISNVIAAHWIVVCGLLAMLRNINNTTQP
jgi:hypothetical protein